MNADASALHHVPTLKNTSRSASNFKTTLCIFCCRSHTVSVFCKVENQNMRLFTQTVIHYQETENIAGFFFAFCTESTELHLTSNDVLSNFYGL